MTDDELVCPPLSRPPPPAAAPARRERAAHRVGRLLGRNARARHGGRGEGRRVRGGHVGNHGHAGGRTLAAAGYGAPRDDAGDEQRRRRRRQLVVAPVAEEADELNLTSPPHPLFYLRAFFCRLLSLLRADVSAGLWLAGRAVPNGFRTVARGPGQSRGVTSHTAAVAAAARAPPPARHPPPPARYLGAASSSPGRSAGADGRVLTDRRPTRWARGKCGGFSKPLKFDVVISFQSRYFFLESG